MPFLGVVRQNCRLDFCPEIDSACNHWAEVIEAPGFTPFGRKLDGVLLKGLLCLFLSVLGNRVKT